MPTPTQKMAFLDDFLSNQNFILEEDNACNCPPHVVIILRNFRLRLVNLNKISDRMSFTMISTEGLILIFAVIVAVVGVLVFFLSKQFSKLKEDLGNDEDKVLVEWLKDMKSSMERNTDTLEKQLQTQRQTLQDQTKLIWERLENSTEVIRQVQKQLGGIQEFGNDMKDLSNILKSPKLRGGLGEQFLYEILANALPTDLFKTQYKFKGGDICDAVVFTDKGIIPIDSKFPMENFKAMLDSQTPEDRDRARKAFLGDFKKRVDEVSSKYILPAEGTTEQAVMYIPSENVFYELIVNTPKAEDYAKEKNVVIASPNTLSYFLKIILVAYQQHELEKHAKEILSSLSGIKVEASKFDDELGVLSRHVSNASKSMDNVQIKFQRLFGKIESVQQLDKKEAQPLIES